MTDLTNRVAIVTASSRGIGFAIAQEMVAAGAVVYMAVRDSEKNRNLVTKLHAENDRYRHVIYNAFEFDTYEPMIKEVAEKEGHVDILVNNFGRTDIDKDLTVTTGDPEMFFTILKTNVASVYYSCRYAIKQMQQQKTGGSIINISSVGGATPDVARTAYGTSKAAINMLTQQIATQYAHDGIRCNAIMPGLIATDAAVENMSGQFWDTFIKNVPLNRPGKPADIAKAAVFLASDDSSYITGQLLPVAGGFGMPTPIYNATLGKDNHFEK